MSAEQDAVGQVGATAPTPGHDVMRLAPGWRAITAGEQASAVARSQADALTRREQPLVATDVDDPAGCVEGHVGRSGVAAMPLDGLDADLSRLPLETTRSGPAHPVSFGD